MHAKQDIDFAVALALFVALTLVAIFWTSRHITHHRGRVDPVKVGSF